MRGATRYVECETTDGHTESGSGVAVSPYKVVTAKHVAMGGLSCKVARPDGTLVPVAKVDINLAGDAAVLSVDVGCPCVSDFTEARVGEAVAIVGYPYGEHLGKVQVLTRGEYHGSFEYHDSDDGSVWQAQVVTAAVASGNSGGGVFVVRRGRAYLVGLTIMVPSGGGVITAYAPISMLQVLL